MGSALRRIGAITLLSGCWVGCSVSFVSQVDGGVTCSPACTAGFACVRGSCAPAACGSTADCPVGGLCVGGVCGDLSCSPPCAAAQVCVDQLCLAKLPATCASSADCGAVGSCVGGVCSQPGCDPACASGEVCLDDVCIPPTGASSCSPPYTACQSGQGFYCANLQGDSSNCGLCDRACAAGEVCNGAGQCAVTCLAGEAECPAPGAAQRCVDIQADQQNCGACGSACPAGEACSKGFCGVTCAAPYVLCGRGQAAYCADEASDPSNCGGCGMTCPAGEGCVQASCVAPCPSPFVGCGASCTDTTWDPANCGGCGAVCATYCDRGVCAAISSSTTTGTTTGTSTDTATGTTTGTTTGTSIGTATGASTDTATGTSNAASTGTGSGGSTSGGLAFSALTVFVGQAGGAGSFDATGTTARFSDPFGLAADGLGNVFVLERNANVIRKVVLATEAVTTVAGTPNTQGSVDGTGAAARFDSAQGLAADGAGNLFVADTYNDTVRAVALATGAVTTLAGSPGVTGSANGVGSAATFFLPDGVATDGAGNLYVLDTCNCTLRQLVVATGAVTTILGAPGVCVVADGTGVAGTLDNPTAVASDGAGNLYIADSDGDIIRQVVLADASVTSLAGHAVTGSSDGVGTAAGFFTIEGLSADGLGNVFAADAFNGTIRQLVVATGAVTTLAGSHGVAGSADGTGAAAEFNFPAGVLDDSAGQLIVADSQNDTLRTVTVDGGAVTTLAGMAPAEAEVDAVGSVARFSYPEGLAGDGEGNLFVADSRNCTLRKVILGTGAVITVAGSVGVFGSADGPGTAATFNWPVALATDTAGNLFVSDRNNSTVRQVVLATSAVTTLAGTALASGSADGTGSAASFLAPTGLAVDGAGNLFVADSGNATLRVVAVASGAVTTLAGSAKLVGSADGTGSSARFLNPEGLAIDGAGHLFVADPGNDDIREVVTATAVVTTLAGSSTGAGSADGIGSAASFDTPEGLATDGAGNLFVADTGNGTIRLVEIATGKVTTVVGVSGQLGVVTGPVSAARLNSPAYLALEPGPTLFISDGAENVILQLR